MAAFSAAERAAMKARAQEAKAEKSRAAGTKAVEDALAEMTGTDRELGRRLHEIISTAAPELEPRTWYGQPAYTKDGAVIVFFQAAGKFKTRYLTLGFQDAAALDDGGMWATSFAVTALDEAEEREIARLVRKAAGA
jgi:uncharacterized protein YdhG (YjbR/CyaY superfamily)